MDSQDVPDIRNEVWNKLSNGDVSLSPYATWEVQLLPKHRGKNQDMYARLALPTNNEESIWMELNGYGSFVAPNAIRADELEKYHWSCVARMHVCSIEMSFSVKHIPSIYCLRIKPLVRN